MIYPNGRLPEKYQRRRKQFVEVVAEHKLDGSTLPKTIILADGRHFEVEMHGDPFRLELAGENGQVTAYPIRRVSGDMSHAEIAASSQNKDDLTYLFESSKRWYVLMKSL